MDHCQHVVAFYRDRHYSKRQHATIGVFYERWAVYQDRARFTAADIPLHPVPGGFVGRHMPREV